jgi:hypothetical protein
MKPLKEYVKIDEYGISHYEDEEGCHYDNLTDLLQIKGLGFCGCGLPEDTLEFVYGLISISEKARTERDGLNYEQSIKLYEKEKAEKRQYFLSNIETVELFFSYFLDREGITTHGGSVYGAWLDDENFFEALKIWHEEYKKDS